MNVKFKRMVPAGNRASRNTTRPAWALAQGAIGSNRGMIRVIFALGLIGGLNLLAAGRLRAQTFTTLHSFTASSTNSAGVYTNSDGANPYASLTVADNSNTRYGTAANGGSWGAGTVFAVNADGTGFTVLHSFNQSDGANPWAGLVLSGNTLYGTTDYGGSSGQGTVFAVNTDGTGFTNLHTFTGLSDGAYPNGGLILSNNTLYGTAAHGGSWGAGTVFALNTDGTGFTNLHSFTATFVQRFYYYACLGSSGPYGYDPCYYQYEYYTEININADGAVPVAGLVLSGGTLYGTATAGGSGGNGTVFAIGTDGTGFRVLHGLEQTENLPQHPVGVIGGGGFGGGGFGGGGFGGGGFGGGCMGFCIGGG